jgi:DNA repair protein RadD
LRLVANKSTSEIAHTTETGRRYVDDLILRPYQVTDIARLRLEYGAGRRAVIYQLSTGGGKTVVFSSVVASAAAKGRRVGVFVHRRELIAQASAKLTWCGVLHGIMAAGLDRDHHETVLVLSIQSAVNRELPQFDFIVIDECHHAVADTWLALLLSQTKAKLLGVSATPARLDGKGLGSHCGGIFDSMVCGPSMKWLISQGYLADTKVFVPARTIDVGGLRKVAGDFAAGDELAKRASIVTGDAVCEYTLHCKVNDANSEVAAMGCAAESSGAGRSDTERGAYKSALAFCVTVQHSADVAEQFRAAGFRAAHVHGGTPKDQRDDLIAAIGDGRLDVLTSCDLIGEGLDVPAVGCVILLRPTGSLTLCRQQIGRGMRPAPGKDALIVLDHANNCDRHGDPAEDDVVWSLDGAVRQPKAKAEADPDTIGFGKPREIEEVAGDLVLREKNAAAKWAAMPYGRFKARRRSTAEVQAFGKAKGYKRGWVRHFLIEQEDRFPATQAVAA